MNADAGQAFGIRWQTWGRLSASSWAVLFTASHIGLALSWKGLESASFGSFTMGLCWAFCCNVPPGAAALLSAPVRQQLVRLPDAGALGSLTLSAALGLYGGFMAARLYLDVSPLVALQGIVWGSFSFCSRWNWYFRWVSRSFAPWRCTRQYGRGDASRRGVFHSLPASRPSAGWAWR